MIKKCNGLVNIHEYNHWINESFMNMADSVIVYVLVDLIENIIETHGKLKTTDTIKNLNN